jgi:hypothetical protein
MCDTYEPPTLKEDGTLAEMVPLPTNSRYAANLAMEKVRAEVRFSWQSKLVNFLGLFHAEVIFMLRPARNIA